MEQYAIGTGTGEIRQLIDQEIWTINKLLEAHQIRARTRRGLTMCVKSSFIAYGLELAQGEKIQRVAGVTGELSHTLTTHRQMAGFRGQALVRLRPDYPLGLEVPHPSPTRLSWRSANLDFVRGTGVGLVGRSYTLAGVNEEIIDLHQQHHTLVAAMSGGGKSTLLRMAIATIMRNSASTDVRFLLIDLKNDDLAIFAQQPHVISYVGNVENAIEAVDYVHRVKEWRISNADERPFRLVLAVDELAELGQSKETLAQLGRVANTGRSLEINILAGTQFPSAGVLGSVMAAGFTCRYVGMVDSKQTANVAAKRAGSGAHLLTTPGSFIRIAAGEMRRIQAYDLPKEETLTLIGSTSSLTGGAA